MIPVPVWIILGLVLVVIFWWKIGDIGNWWEQRKQKQFDKADAAKQIEMDEMRKQRDELLVRAREAEAREQTEKLKVDQMRQLIAERGGKIEAEQKKIDEAQKKYDEDKSIIEAAGRGDISKFELCQRQCADSAALGYPCRANYCDQFK